MQAKIITMVGNEDSESLARECQDSCKEHNIEASIYPAVWGDAVAHEYEKWGLRPFHKLKESRNTKGVRGCFLSHYKLWREVAETEKPMIIFEHDALVLRPITEDLLRHAYGVLNLDAFSRRVDNYEEFLKRPFTEGILRNAVEIPRLQQNFDTYNKLSIKGLHSYILKPLGARDLINFTQEIGVLPADITVNSQSCDLWMTISSYCRINPRFWLSNKRKSINSFTRKKDHEW